ncbi:MAG: hypothetical protein Q9212_001673 [Teloschistes hypoglaucus]
MDHHCQQVPKAVPRFASFRNTLDASKANGDRESRESPAIDRTYEKKRRRHHYGTTQSLCTRKCPLTVKDDQGVEWRDFPLPFTIDVKGDPHGLNYGFRHEIPSYYHPSTRVVLGSESILRFSALDNGRARHEKNLLSRKLRTDIKHQKLVRKDRNANSPSRDLKGAGFIPLQTVGSRERKREGHHHKPRSPQSSVTEETTDDCSNDRYGGRLLALEDDLQQERADLRRNLDRNPADWRAWLRLVTLQDRMDGSSLPGSANANRRSNAEVSMAIYERALRSVIDLGGRAHIYLGMMSKALIFWERDKIISRWQTILGQCPLHFQLWRKYLDFHHSTLSGSTLEETRKYYLDSVAILQKQKDHVECPQAQQSSIYTIQVYVLLRLSLLLNEGGYSELAVATWQALLEFGFNKASRTSSSRSNTEKSPIDLVGTGRVGGSATVEKSSTFEQFWDSEVPRIGELNARGWSSFKDGEGEQWQPLSANGTVSEDDSTGIKLWAEAERQVSDSARVPGRTTDEPMGDPFRVVLFSDVQFAMIESPTVSDHSTLLTAFLRFCYLPPCSDLSTTKTQIWGSDQFIHNQTLYDHPRTAKSLLEKPSASESDIGNLNSGITPNPRHDLALPHAFQFPLINYEISSDNLFCSPGQWFSAFASWGDRPSQTPKDFVVRTLQMLAGRDIGGEGFAEYVLALELQISPTTVRKSAKSLLKKRPASLRLYNAFYLIECRLGKIEAADKVCNTAVHLINNLGDAAGRDAILLWRSRVWQHLATGKVGIALERLLEYGLEDGLGTGGFNGRVLDSMSSTIHLRLRNALTAGRDHMLLLSLPTHAVYFSDLLVLADYLINDLSLEAAFSSFKTHLQNFHAKSSPTRAAEALFRQSFARLLFIHTMQKHPHSPSFIRYFLAESIAIFPHNTIFLSLYAWNESKFRIEDRVRGILRETVLANRQLCDQYEDDNSDHIITQFFAVHTDMQRGLLLDSNHNAIRGTFERALSSEGAAHGAGLWKLYFLFEHSSGNVERAKEVFWRAVGACPWSKEIYMLAFECLGEGEMNEEELRAVHDLMVQRELRIRVAL